MAEFVALPLFTDAYLADTRHLTTEEHGAYLLLMMEAWRRPECSIPDDDKLIARLCGLPLNRWMEVKDVVLAFWKRDGRKKTWSQKRLTKERGYVREKRQSAKDAAVTRWNKTKKDDAVALRSQSPHTPPTPHPSYPSDTPVKDGGGSASAREISDPTFREKILTAIGVDPVSGLTGHGGRQLGTQGDMAEAGRWLELPGITPETALAEVARIMAGKRDGPPKSFGYFTGAMCRLSADLTAPKLEPAPNTTPAAKGNRHDENRAFGAAIHQLADGLSAGTVQLETASRDPWRQ